MRQLLREIGVSNRRSLTFLYYMFEQKKKFKMKRVKNLQRIYWSTRVRLVFMTYSMVEEVETGVKATRGIFYDPFRKTHRH